MTCQTNCRMSPCACSFPPFLGGSSAARDSETAVSGLHLPRELDGRRGLNRASGSKGHFAQNDLDALRAWLTHYASSPSTLASYRREAERLLFWALLDREKPLSSLTHDDLAGYSAFLADPQPRERWVSVHGVRLARDRNGWRPFAGPLSPHSVQQSLAVTNRMFDWLVETGYLLSNPLRKPEDKPRPASLRSVAPAQDDLLGIVTTTLDALPRATSRESEHAERARWLFALLYHGGLRIPEVSRHTMSAFHVRLSGDSGEWWFALDGTRSATRARPASRELMQALIRYRRAQGLTPLPERYESTPLVLPIGGRDQPLQPRVLHGVVKTLFLAASRLADKEDGSWLKGGCPNWLRHFSEAALDANSIAASVEEVVALVFAVTGGRPLRQYDHYSRTEEHRP